MCVYEVVFSEVYGNWGCVSQGNKHDSTHDVELMFELV